MDFHAQCVMVGRSAIDRTMMGVADFPKGIA